MAKTDRIKKKWSQVVSQELGDFFLAPSNDRTSAGENVGIAESFKVWMVTLGDFRESLLSKAVWQGVWHHQIGTRPGGARSYARSVVGLEKSVRGVYRSELAAELDRAINEIDGKSEFADDALIVRLLVIPELNFTAVWITDAVDSLIPLGKYARLGFLHFEPLPADSVRELLRDEKPIVGLVGELSC